METHPGVIQGRPEAVYPHQGVVETEPGFVGAQPEVKVGHYVVKHSSCIPYCSKYSTFGQINF
jgi:hypothetical protein